MESEKLKLGIVGAGHLGSALALALIQAGYTKERVMISCRGSASSCRRLEENGLCSCKAANEDIFHNAHLIFIAVKPADIGSLEGLTAQKGALIISCAAGMKLSRMNKMVYGDLCRVMFSGPDTILSGSGMAALYPAQRKIEPVLKKLGLRIYLMHRESDLDVFTAGVCMPAALSVTGTGETAAKGIEEIGKEYPLLKELYPWAKSVTPNFVSADEKERYLTKMSTKGGITEAIIQSLRGGEPLPKALQRGIERSKAISNMIPEAFETQRSER